MAILMDESQNSVQAIAEPEPQSDQAGWFRVGVIAAASALAGGLAAAWYYRKTLARLQEAGSAVAPDESDPDPDYEA